MIVQQIIPIALNLNLGGHHPHNDLSLLPMHPSVSIVVRAAVICETTLASPQLSNIHVHLEMPFHCRLLCCRSAPSGSHGEKVRKLEIVIAHYSEWNAEQVRTFWLSFINMPKVSTESSVFCQWIGLPIFHRSSLCL